MTAASARLLIQVATVVAALADDAGRGRDANDIMKLVGEAEADEAALNRYCQRNRDAAAAWQTAWNAAPHLEIKRPIPEPPPRPLLQGEINVGDVFIWEPNIPQAWARIRVVAVQHVPGDDTRISTETLECTRGRTGGIVWNDESRFREACVREVP
jgi:hypothetical protein